MPNYVINIAAVANRSLKIITASYTFEEPTPFTVYLPAYSYNDRNDELRVDDHILLRRQKDATFNALGIWTGQYTAEHTKIIFADEQLMAAAILAINNRDHVYLRYHTKARSSIYYQFAYEMSSQDLEFFFDTITVGRKLKPLDINQFNKEMLDDFEDLLNQVRTANLIYSDLERQVQKHPHRLLTDVINDNAILQQQLAVVDAGSCDQYKCGQ